MTESVKESLKWAIKHVKFDLDESLIRRRVYRDLIKNGKDYNTAKDLYEKSARKYIQRLKNFKKLLKEYNKNV